jgi:hypothetical protein
MTLDQSVLSELLDAFRTGEGQAADPRRSGRGARRDETRECSCNRQVLGSISTAGSRTTCSERFLSARNR